MPIYEYCCQSCGFQKEFLQKVGEPLLTVCPECGQESFRKLLSAAGFQLKGSGWYATDFKGGGSKPKSETESSKTSETSGTSSGGHGCAAGACGCAPKAEA
jgi:putative FmdB family regulatory protein